MNRTRKPFKDIVWRGRTLFFLSNLSRGVRGWGAMICHDSQLNVLNITSFPHEGHRARSELGVAKRIKLKEIARFGAWLAGERQKYECINEMAGNMMGTKRVPGQRGIRGLSLWPVRSTSYLRY